MVTVPVLAFLQFCPIPVLAWYITSTAIAWCPYQYWHFGNWFIISIGMVLYRYWHLMVPIPVMAFMHLGPLPVLAWYITVTGIKWCQYRYWHICTFVQYQYWHGRLPVLTLLGACTGIAIFGTLVQYQYWHGPLPVLASNGARTGIGVFGTLVQYQYRHGTLLELASNGVRAGIGKYAFWSSTSIGTVHYRYGH
jgi:hypothetical protein